MSESEQEKHYFKYNDYTIYPTPRLKADSGRWRIQLTIRCKDSCRRFNLNDEYPTREEAVLKCINLGITLIKSGITFDDPDVEHIQINV